MSEQNKYIARRLCEEVIGRGDLALADELVSSGFVGHGSGGPGQTQDIEGYKQFVTAMRTAFPDLAVRVEDQVAEGDRVVTRWSATGTHTGSFFGVPPSGKPGTLSGISLERFADGQSVECWVNSDELGLMQQIGAIPAGSTPG